MGFRNCNECQRNKERNHQPNDGKMQSEMETNLIEPLSELKNPTTGEKCNAMLVVVDRFSNFVILIQSYRQGKISEANMADLMMKPVFAYTEFPQSTPAINCSDGCNRRGKKR
jgi:hypothetical protein